MSMQFDFINLQQPDSVAVITENGQSVTYRQLADDTIRVSNQLFPQTTLFIISKNDYPALLFYIAGIEFQTVPLMLNDKLSEQRILELINQYLPNFILVETIKTELFSDYDTVGYEQQYSLLKHKKNINHVINSELAFLATTSGSTGSPKLVRFSKKNLLANALSITEYLSITPYDRAIVHLPISYSYGLSIVNSHLLAGASFYLTNETIMDKSFWSNMVRYEITSFSGVPFHYESLLRMKLDSMKLPALKVMTQAGGKLSEKHQLKMQELVKKIGVEFWVMYGQTEASPRIAYVQPENLTDYIGSIGKAIPGGKLWIQDENNNDITTSNKTGELVYEGENVCLGYAESLDDLERKDENHGILKTGDLASFKNGYFYLEGRLKRFIKVFGNRISLSHVETTLSDMGLKAAAYGIDDKLTVVIESEQMFDESSLKKSLAVLFSINFTAIKIRTVPQIPRFDSGKVDYQCLMK